MILCYIIFYSIILYYIRAIQLDPTPSQNQNGNFRGLTRSRLLFAWGGLPHIYYTLLYILCYTYYTLCLYLSLSLYIYIYLYLYLLYSTLLYTTLHYSTLQFNVNTCYCIVCIMLLCLYYIV